MIVAAFATLVANAALATVPADAALDAAIALANGGRFAEARVALEKLAAERPDDTTALAWLAYAQVSLGDDEATLATTEKALRLAPASGPLWYHRGRALLLQHDFAAADTAFGKCRELSPDFFPAWRSHFDALAALGLGDEKRARELYAHSPEAAEPWADPAFLFERMATLYPIVPEPEPARGWYRRAASEYFAAKPPLPPLALALPLRGAWRVGQGNFGDESHFGIAGSFSFDLQKVVGGQTAKKAFAQAQSADFFTYGETVVAPGAATVVRVVDGLPENGASCGDLRPLAAREVVMNPLGNHVVLRFDEHAFLLLAHLRAGTIRVKEGDAVASGAELARIGQSGVSYAPHLHLTAWSSLTPPIGRPLRFLHADAPAGTTPKIGDVLERE